MEYPLISTFTDEEGGVDEQAYEDAWDAACDAADDSNHDDKD